MSAEPEMFYIMDTRQVVGNCAMWWAPNGHGYVCGLDEAGKYTREEAFSKRDTDVPVPCAIADAAAVRHVRVDGPAMEDYYKPAKRRHR